MSDQQKPKDQEPDKTATAAASAQAARSEKSEKPAAEPKQPRPAHKRKPRSKHHRLIVTVVIIILLLGGTSGGLGWMYLQSRDQLVALDRGLQQVNSRLGAVDSRAGQLAQKQAENAARQAQQLAELQQQLTTTDQELTAARDALAQVQETRGTGITWKVAEVEYLLEVANHRLQLQQDPRTALAALQAARQRLKKMANPGLTDIRARITAEIQSLEALDNPDITELVLELSAMENSVDKLPLSPESQFVFAPGNADKVASEESGESSWQALASRAWDDISKLITPRRVDKPVQPLLPPDQAYFLLQNLKLKLGAVRLAALRGDDSNFHKMAAEAREWLDEYFDGEQPAVAAMGSALDKYRTTKLSQAMPDISGSLMALRAWRRQREGAQ